MNMLKADGYDHEIHYDEVCSWWKAQDWPIVPPGALPQIGIVISDGYQKVCAGWLYQTDSTIAIMEWIVANPEVEQPLRGQALDTLIATLKEAAKEANYHFVFSFARNEKLLRRYEDNGFVMADTDMTHVLWRNEQWH